MSSQRAIIIAALVTRLQTITVLNGYATAIGTKVFPWRTTVVPENQLPCLIVNDTEIHRDYGSSVGQARNNMTVEITALFSGTTSADNARALELDLYKCLHGYETVGGAASWLSVDKSEIQMQQNEHIGGAVHAVVTITFDTARGSI